MGLVGRLAIVYADSHAFQWELNVLKEKTSSHFSFHAQLSGHESNLMDKAITAIRPSQALQSEIDKLLKIAWVKPRDVTSELILDITNSAKLIADELRDLRLRTAVGETELISHVLALLRDLIVVSKHSSSPSIDGIIEADEQLMRVLGNLVHTHDINRQKCLSHRAPEIFNDLINLPDFAPSSLIERNATSQPNARCLQILMTVLLNLCFEYVPAHSAYIEAGLVKPLCLLVELTGETQTQIPLLAIRLLEELSSTDDGKQMMPVDVVQALVAPIFFVQDQTRTSLVDESGVISFTETLAIASSLLESLSDVSQPIQKAIRTNPVPSKYQIEAPLEMIGKPSELWNTTFGRLLCFVRFTELPNAWDLESSDEENESPIKMMNKTKANLARALTSAVGETNDGLVEILVKWLSEPGLVSNRPDVITTLGLLLGNVACSDAASTRLIQSHRILEPLTSAFQVWVLPNQIPASARPGEQAQVLHSLSGLARNLAVAEVNKDPVGASGLIELVADCLRPEFDLVQPLLANALGFLRHVCHRHLPNVLRLTACGGAERVIDVVKRVDQPHIRLEAARLLASTIGTVSLSRTDGEHTSAPLPSDDQVQASTLLSHRGVVEAVVELLRVGARSNVLLINEALVALALLATRPESASRLAEVLTETREEVGEGEEGAEQAIEVLLGCWLGWDRASEMFSGIGIGIGSSKFKSPIVLADMVRRNAGVVIETLGRTLKGEKKNKVVVVVKEEEEGVLMIKNLLKNLVNDGLLELNEEEILNVWRKDDDDDEKFIY
ncbi:hypothetical protein CROQUDRAFT_93868 [Cronartium quercuum f. sp. fusiforme G11]|uniref:ARM repeat superfamily protein n=1 Tax=Cronartium quercuum f. sp. fusiforme G11 TaxID=708437 RepID=A0A9P6NG29_9BASI|nr:hypothetical protein CROQUDRAFT_93868 [Cronartium quercuum f. sp. fusiforme G11]